MEETFLAIQEENARWEDGGTTIPRLGTEIVPGVFNIDTEEVRYNFEDSDVPQILLQAQQAHRSNYRGVSNGLNDVQKARGCFPKGK